MTMLQHNYQMVCSQLADAVQQAGRPSGSVQLVAVSKTFPAEAIREVYAAGQRDFDKPQTPRLFLLRFAKLAATIGD